jgi:tRNA(Ile2) C34 agmatinyltransferase TiaS
VHIIIGIDNTDSLEEGATFALAIALLDYLSNCQVHFDWPSYCNAVAEIPEKTAETPVVH